MEEEMHNSPDADEAPDKIMKKKGVRGPTLSNKLKKASEKLVIEFNSEGEIKGSYMRSQVADWQGTIARTMVPLSERGKWSEYKSKFKDDLWEYFLKKFDVDLKYKKICLQCIGVCWRNFKYLLTSRYILPNIESPELLENPPEEYNFLKINDWKLFVKSRLTAEFEELSQLQSERREKNQYNHRLSRKGYAGLKEDMEKVTGKPYEDDRSLLWLLARQDSNGHYKNEATREMAGKIVKLKQEVKDGTVVVKGTNDILTMAYDNPEHDGRVRGVGKYFTPTKYFDIPRRTSKTKKLETEMESMRSKLKAYESMLIDHGLLDLIPSEKVASNSARSDNRRESSFATNNSKKNIPCSDPPFKANAKNIGEKGGKATSRRPILKLPSKTRQVEDVHTKVAAFDNPSSAKSKRLSDQNFILNENNKKYKQSKDDKVASEEPLSNAQPKYQQVQSCCLAIGSKDNIVARGAVFGSMGSNETLHSVPLGKENVRVSIAVADKPKELLPVPIGDEYLTVGSAIGVPVAWPRKFVIIGTEDVEENDEPLEEDRRQQEVDRRMEADEDYDEDQHITLFTQYTDIVRGLPLDEHIVPIDKGVFELDADFSISNDEILDICNMDWLNANCIIAYMRFLYETYESSRDAYGFCYPADISRFAKSRKKNEDMDFFIKDRLLKCKADQIIFLPYNTGHHWTLLMIDVNGKEIFYFDSNGAKEPPTSVKVMMTTALIHLSTEKKKRPQPSSWSIVKCPIQPGSFECGYFVMSFMKHFMENPTKSIKTKMMELSNKETYTNAELIAIRLELINYIIPLIS